MCKREIYLVLCYAMLFLLEGAASYGLCMQECFGKGKMKKRKRKKGVAMREREQFVWLSVSWTGLNGYPLLAFCKKAGRKRSR